MKGFLKGSTILIIGDLITKLLTFLYLIPLARIDPAIASLMSKLIISFSLVIVLTSFGITIMVTSEVAKYYGKNQDKLKTILYNSFAILFILSIVSTLFVLVFAENIAYIVEREDTQYMDDFIVGIRLISISVLLFTISSYLRSILGGLGEYTHASISIILEQIIKIFIILLGAYLLIEVQQQEISAIYYITALSIGVSLLVKIVYMSIVLIKKKYLRIFTEGTYLGEKEEFMTIFLGGTVYYVSALYVSFFDMIDLVMFNKLYYEDVRNAIQYERYVGEYFTYSYKFVMLPIQLSSAFIMAMLREVHTEEANKADNVNKMIDIAMIFSLVSVAGLFFVIYNLEIMFYAIEPTLVGTLLVLIIPFYIVRNIINSFVVTNGGSRKKVLINSIITISLKFVLDIVFYQFFSVNGFVLSSMVSLTFSIIHLNYVGRQILIPTVSHTKIRSIIVIKFLIIIALTFALKYGLSFVEISLLLETMVIGLFVLCLAIIAYKKNIDQVRAVS